jgi:hypothetical protein
MRMNQLTKQLDLHFVTKRPLMLRGPAGVGKTAIVKAYAAAKGVKVFEYRIAYCEPGDLKGLCDPKDGMMTFLRPDDLPRETDVNAILFLDEVNRGSMSVMNCVMQATDGSARIGSHKLPPGCLVIAAVNGDSGYNVNSMDPALRSRFAIIDVEYDRTCLLDYAKAAGWHPRVLGFIAAERNLFAKAADDDGESNHCNPRTLNYLSDMEHAGLIDSTSHHLETSIGLLGPNIGREYHAYANGEQPITLAELFSADGVARAKRLSAPDNLRADLLGVTNGEIVAFYAKQAPASLVASEHEAIVNYLQVLPADLAVGVLKTVCTARPEYTDKFQAETKLMRRLGERLTKTEGA